MKFRLPMRIYIDCLQLNKLKTKDIEYITENISMVE